MTTRRDFITDEVRFADGKLVLPGALLARIGKECDSDDSQPGTLVWTAYESRTWTM